MSEEFFGVASRQQSRETKKLMENGSIYTALPDGESFFVRRHLSSFSLSSFFSCGHESDSFFVLSIHACVVLWLYHYFIPPSFTARWQPINKFKKMTTNIYYSTKNDLYFTCVYTQKIRAGIQGRFSKLKITKKKKKHNQKYFSNYIAR